MTALKDFAVANYREKLRVRVDAHGWIKHDGGGCRAPSAAIIDAQFRNGSVHRGIQARHFVWGWDPRLSRYDIIAFRIIREPRP